MSDANSSYDGSQHEPECAEETPLSSGFPSPAEATKEDYVNTEPCTNGVVDVAQMATQSSPSRPHTMEGNMYHAHDLSLAEQDQGYMRQRQSHMRANYNEMRPEEAFGRRSSQLSSLLDDEFIDQDPELSQTEEHVEKARAKVQQYSQYIHVMEERVSLLESKIRKMEKSDETVKPSKPKPKELHLPAIPELHFVKWFDFKHKYADDKQTYAIEVLVGNARYFHQYKIDEQIRKYVARGGIYESDSILQASQADYTPGSLQEMPGRIRINSHPLLAILSHIAAKDWSMRPRVLLKPYKLLVHFESEIKEYLKKLEEKWAHADIPQLRGRGARLESHNCVRADHGVDTGAERNADVADVHRKSGDSAGSGEHGVPEGIDSDKKPREGIHEEKKSDDFEDLLESYEALSDLKCLVRFMNRYLSPVLKRFNKASLKKIEFEDLWYLFKPGDEVYAPAPKVAAMEINHQTSPEKARRPNRYQTSWRVLFVGGGRPALTADEETKPLLESRSHDFILTCYYLDYNGRQYGPTCCNFVIKPFEGAIDITSLEVYPWRYSKMAATIREKLRKEGELFREYVDAKHLTYDGTSLTHHPCGRPLLVPGAPNHPEGIEGQVIVGFEEGAQIDPGWLAPIGFPDEMNVFSSEVVESYPTRLWTDRDQMTSTDSWTDIIHSDISIDKLRYTELVESDPFLRAWESRYFNENSADDGDLRDEDLILLPTRVLAYVFRERKFALLSLHGLRKCRTDVDGFGNLKLLPGYKKMVKSLVMTHFMKKRASVTWGRNDTMDFDVVYGKSRGLIILLHGVPGVGKTSTAECVAEATGKPLFPITCGDLGLTPEHVEKTLRDTFHLAQLWDCVLLLDEADIFLAQRNKTDLQRNALVSVFLRVLEYYSGILFLTTNRVGVIDEAFKSRIHVTLLYPELTEPQTKAIWKMNLDRLRKIDKERAERAHDPEMIIDETAIMDFQKRHFQECRENRRVWNGRQIRNAFQTASALALFDAHQANINRFDEQADVEKAVPVLKVDYFERVDKASSDFDLYVSETAGVGGKSAAERARDRGERADHLKFYGGNPLENHTQLRPANTRRVSFNQNNLQQQSQNSHYSGIHMHREHSQQQVYGSSPRAAQFNSSSTTLYEPRQPGSSAVIYEHSQPPHVGSETPIYSDSMPSSTPPRLIRRESFNEYDYDDED